MIKIEFSLAIALYLILTIALVVIIWGVTERRRILRISSIKETFFWQCNICTYVYVDSVHNVLTKCPRCGSYNKKEEDIL